jgi:outer membrane receptor for ferrienterochelin and colicin
VRPAAKLSHLRTPAGSGRFFHAVPGTRARGVGAYSHVYQLSFAMHSRSFFFLSFLSITAVSLAPAQTSPNANSPPTTTSSPVVLDPFIVTGQLDQAREEIVPSLGGTEYDINKNEINALALGDNAPFNQVLLRAPGVAQDSAANGDLHVRGEHANLQYRVNGVLLPEGITGFGLELDPRFVENLEFITGSLPAQYGFRAAGIVDIKTKGGATENGGNVEVNGGSYDTSHPSFEYGGSAGNSTYFVDGSHDHNDIGLENPTTSARPIHDTTDQSKSFVYLSHVLDATSRISFIGSASYSNFQIPNTPGLPVGTAPGGNPFNSTQGPETFDSSALNERQNEQNYYGVVTYQKRAGDLNYQVSALGRDSSVHFMPDPVGDLFFNGVASDVNRKLYSGGIEADVSYNAGDQHTVRGGAIWLSESVSADSTTTVFDLDANGNPTGAAFPIVDNHALHGLFAGLYLQDEWKISPAFTINYGTRFDVFNSSFDNEHQLSPRINFIYQPTASTTLHTGYARYFTPPPIENVSGSTVALFDNTSNAAASDQDDPVKAERSNYFDAGISQRLAPGWQVGVDGYYKQAKNQLDDGLFGQTLILSAFNYAKGKVYGVEFTTSYSTGGFSTYANVAFGSAYGKDFNSSQFLFASDRLAYSKSNWIHLDHEQKTTGSLGASYLWSESHGGTQVYADALYGTGLRTDSTAPDGSTIPNGGTVPAYYTINLGAEQTFKIGARQTLKVRLDIVNLTDKVYELRDGSGIGVNAAQFGQRRGLYGTVTFAF